MTDPSFTNYPSPIQSEKSTLSDEEKMALIADRFRDIMEVLDLDLTNPSLQKTPQRVAKMYLNEIFSGLKQENFPEISFIPNEYANEGRSNIVFSQMKFNSFCEHHFVPMNGTAYVAYIPNKKLIGLSKIPRIVRYFSRRPQVQERLSAQIADCLSILLDTDDVAVSMNAKHYCVIARGIEDETGSTTTNVLRGAFETDDVRREEFFDAIRRS